MKNPISITGLAKAADVVGALARMAENPRGTMENPRKDNQQFWNDIGYSAARKDQRSGIDLLASARDRMANERQTLYEAADALAAGCQEEPWWQDEVFDRIVRRCKNPQDPWGSQCVQDAVNYWGEGYAQFVIDNIGDTAENPRLRKIRPRVYDPYEHKQHRPRMLYNKAQKRATIGDRSEWKGRLRGTITSPRSKYRGTRYNPGPIGPVMREAFRPKPASTWTISQRPESMPVDAYERAVRQAGANFLAAFNGMRRRGASVAEAEAEAVRWVKESTGIDWQKNPNLSPAAARRMVGRGARIDAASRKLLGLNPKRKGLSAAAKEYVRKQLKRIAGNARSPKVRGKALAKAMAMARKKFGK